MTLVLSCLTDRYVLQVSDRRLTNIVSGRAIPGQFNKAVLFTNSIAFAYTGLAKIEGQDTDAWLADALSSGDDVNSGLLAVRDRATAAFRRLPCALALKTHAFVAVGWDRPPNGNRWQPWICWISNSLDDAGRWRFPPRDTFDVSASVLRGARGKKPLVLSVVGQPLRRPEHVDLMRDLRRYVDHEVAPAAVSDRLVAQIRQVADRTPTVGHDVMVNAIPLLPQRFESAQMFALSDRPGLDAQTFSHVPAGTQTAIEVGPRAAFPGGAQVFSFESRKLDEPGDVEVTIGFKTPRRLS